MVATMTQLQNLYQYLSSESNNCTKLDPDISVIQLQAEPPQEAVQRDSSPCPVSSCGETQPTGKGTELHMLLI